MPRVSKRKANALAAADGADKKNKSDAKAEATDSKKADSEKTQLEMPTADEAIALRDARMRQLDLGSYFAGMMSGVAGAIKAEASDGFDRAQFNLVPSNEANAPGTVVRKCGCSRVWNVYVQSGETSEKIFTRARAVFEKVNGKSGADFTFDTCTKGVGHYFVVLWDE